MFCTRENPVFAAFVMYTITESISYVQTVALASRMWCGVRRVARLSLEDRVACSGHAVRESWHSQVLPGTASGAQGPKPAAVLSHAIPPLCDRFLGLVLSLSSRQAAGYGVSHTP